LIEGKAIRLPLVAQQTFNAGAVRIKWQFTYHLVMLLANFG
jgi:hypothetical protein